MFVQDSGVASPTDLFQLTQLSDIAQATRREPQQAGVCRTIGTAELKSLRAGRTSGLRYFRSLVDDDTGELIRKRDRASPRFWINCSD